MDAICPQIVDPFNGFWASIGWSLACLTPSAALAAILVYTQFFF